MTNKELARKLGISPASLSLIINHKAGVSSFTRNSILAKLQEMGYGHLIKNTSLTPTNNLCFIIYKRHGEILDLHPFFLLLMENIEGHARTYGYNIFLCTIDKHCDIEPQIQHVNELGCHGVILFATEMQDDDMEEFHRLTMPVVALDNDFTNLSCNTVSINNQMGAYQAIEYLVNSGHTRLGYLKSMIRINSFNERQQGFEESLKYFGLAFSSSDIITVHYTEEGSYRDIKQYLQNNPTATLPSAFVCDDDTLAVGAMRAFTEHGYRIPDDISLVGFNDRPACEITKPPLTTINVSKSALATEAVDELMRFIQRKEQGCERFISRKIRIGTELVLRQSTAKI